MATVIATVRGVCLQCGNEFERPYRGSGVRPTLCSNACKVARFKARRPERVAESRAREAASRRAVVRLCACGGVCPPRKRTCEPCRDQRQCVAATKANAYARAYAAASKAIIDRPCKECGNSFAPEYGNKRRSYCSGPCLRRAMKRQARKKERARLRLAVSENVNPTTVFERDGWRCQCCRKATTRERRGTYHPRAPELDHIIPLSKGGDHTYRNTQLLCRACNAAKSDNDQGQQMRLFG